MPSKRPASKPVPKAVPKAAPKAAFITVLGVSTPTLDLKTFKSKKSLKVDHSQAFIAKALLGHSVPGFKVCVANKWCEETVVDMSICMELEELANAEESYVRGTIAKLRYSMRSDLEGPTYHPISGPLD